MTKREVRFYEDELLMLLGRHALPPWPGPEGELLGCDVDCAPMVQLILRDLRRIELPPERGSEEALDDVTGWPLDILPPSTERTLNANTDARDWASEFVRTWESFKVPAGSAPDRGWMLTWFANAIEAGRDAGYKAGRLASGQDPNE